MHVVLRLMKRRIIAAVWISGATIPLLLAVVFLVGCCVLPFHGVMHKLMPLCDIAATIVRGEHEEDSHEHAAIPPAREKQDAGKRIDTAVPMTFRLAAANRTTRLLVENAATAYRSFISLGAVRCDQDVGLHVLVETFLI